MESPATPSELEEDFRFLSEMKRFMVSEVHRLRASSGNEGNTSQIKGGNFTHLPDSRRIRALFPNGLPDHSVVPDNKEATGKDDVDFRLTTGPDSENGSKNESDAVCFVGFIGFKKELEEETERRLWALDGELAAELGRHPEFLAYVAAEQKCGGDWANLVLFSNMAAVSGWQQCPIHQGAVKDVAPIVYSNVRIHRGVLDQGMASPQIRLLQTIFLDYRDGVQRQVTVW